jgi:hypothetical protein
MQNQTTCVIISSRFSLKELGMEFLESLLAIWLFSMLMVIGMLFFPQASGQPRTKIELAADLLMIVPLAPFFLGYNFASVVAGIHFLTKKPD